jgi:hypothetical protein
MAVVVLNRLELLSGQATVLQIGAGAGPLAFFLSERCREVFAVDEYGHIEAHDAPVRMLFDPERVAQQPFPGERLVVQPMDPRSLRFPDGRFDAVVVARDLPNVSDLKDLSFVSHEIGRVLNHGGIAVIALRYRLAGPPGGTGADGWVSVSPEELERFVLEAGGLELVEDPSFSLSEATWQSHRVLPFSPELSAPPPVIEIDCGYGIATLQIVLRKAPGARPARWARPLKEEISIRHEARPEISRRGSPDRASGDNVQACQGRIPVGDASPNLKNDKDGIWQRTDLSVFFDRWNEVRARGAIDPESRRSVPVRAFGFLGRTMRRVRDLGIAADRLRDLLKATVDWQTALVPRLRSFQERLVSSGNFLEAEVKNLRSDIDMLSSRLDLATRELEQSSRFGDDSKRLIELLIRVRLTLDRYEQAPTVDDDVLDRIVALARECEGFHASHPDVLSEHISRLDGLAVRLAAEADREVERAPRRQPAQPRCDLTRNQLLRLFARLEAMDPAITNAASVEVSVRDVTAEEVVFAAVEHFGDRMSCLAPERYRTPNDLWIHFDFTHHWRRPNLWESARARLEKPRGRLALVTRADHEAPQVPWLELTGSQTLTLDSATVRVFLWSFVPASLDGS